MIQSERDLVVVLRQLRLVEESLELLRADVEARNPKNFAIYAEGYVDQIDLLKADIDAYLASKQAKPPDATPAPTNADQPSANVS